MAFLYIKKKGFYFTVMGGFILQQKNLILQLKVYRHNEAQQSELI